MKLRNLLAILALCVSFAGCGPKTDTSVPDELIGLWKTSAPGYEDNSLELRKGEIVFGVGEGNFNVNSVFKVETVPRPGEKASEIKIYYTGEGGEDNSSTIYYDPAHPQELSFKYQMQIKWKLVRRGAGQEGLLFFPRTSAGAERKHSNLSLALALLGVALATSAALWRWHKAWVAELVSRIEKVAAVPAQSTESKTGRALETTPLPEAVRHQRRSERILLKVPVQVAGITESGTEFREDTSTLSVSRHGGFILLRNSARYGDTVAVTNRATGQSALFRLCWLDKIPTSEFTAWGIECHEPEINFWQIRFPETPPEPLPQENITVLIACATCRAREVGELSPTQYRVMLEKDSMTRYCADCGVATEWNFILVEATGPEEASEVARPSEEEHRREKRIVAKLAVRLTHPDDGQVEHTVTENVSKSGVCCAASMKLNVQDVILLAFEVGPELSEDEKPARIMWCSSMGEIGKTLYGIRFEPKES